MAAQTRIRNASGTLRTVARIRMRDAGGVLRTIQRIRMRDTTGTLRTVFQYLSAVISATKSASASGAFSSGVVTTATETVTVSGGTAPYTYAWTRVAGNLAIVATAPAAATTNFQATVTDSGSPYIAYFQVTVTDTNGAVVTSNMIEVQLTWIDTR